MAANQRPVSGVTAGSGFYRPFPACGSIVTVVVAQVSGREFMRNPQATASDIPTDRISSRLGCGCEGSGVTRGVSGMDPVDGGDGERPAVGALTVWRRSLPLP